MLDVFVSSFPHYVERARRLGVSAAYLALAFDAGLTPRDDARPRDIAVSFVGSLSAYHARRIALLSAVAERVPLDAWVPEVPASMRAGRPSITFHGAAWGRAMYDVLGRSRMTINVHGEISAGYANNLRMFEATGMGAVLVTEDATNLAELFDPGNEIVAYRDAEDLVAIVGHLLAHPKEAEEIAARGQARTMRDHSWERRMAQLVEIFVAVARDPSGMTENLTPRPSGHVVQESTPPSQAGDVSPLDGRGRTP
jgi:glycosyltransferase involved in cell wall biosynthesis